MSGEAVDIAVIGCGSAGLVAALAAKQQAVADGRELRVALVERATEGAHGGNSRWTSALLRLSDARTPAEGFVDDLIQFSGGRVDRAYAQLLHDAIPPTLAWLEGLGVQFRERRTSREARHRPRMEPVGAGAEVVRVLTEQAAQNGVPVRYATTALRLSLSSAGQIDGLLLRNAAGEQSVLHARAIVIASGGFEGNPEMLTQYLGRHAGELRPIAPGGRFNKGEGIRMALALGAKPGGQWDEFHAEPIDPRSDKPDAMVTIYPWGILVNQAGERFIDEARDTQDETYEEVARAIWRQPGSVAYALFDQRLLEIQGYEAGIWTDVPAITADTVTELALRSGVDPARLEVTVRDYNASLDPTAGFDHRILDGKAAVGLVVPKSNWATPLDRPPYICYPIGCAITFTFGGIATDLEGRVVSADDVAIPGLYAAGECTGLYHKKYTGGTSVLRGLVFGRRAGIDAAQFVSRSVPTGV